MKIAVKYQIETNPIKPPAPEIPSDQLLNPSGGTDKIISTNFFFQLLSSEWNGGN